MIFDEDEIHRIRVELAERRAKMTPEDARADRQRSAENVRRTMAEIRNKKLGGAIIGS
ncbi:MAG: hypothetical protein LBP75_03690 [Planctomycetota bacterium]|jgi:hypothetical protein|nr:hypothetical protein [Planctomycetota bacterium]